MATDKATGDNARKGAVRKRSALKGKVMGKTAWTKRSKETGKFMDVKKSPNRPELSFQAGLRARARRHRLEV